MLLRSELVIVISGAASGLGAATARLLHEHGCQLALLDANAQKLSALATELNALAIPVDVTAEAGIEKAFHEIQHKLGACHVVVNCAGVAPAKRIIGREGVMPLADFTDVIGINLVGSFNVMRVAAQMMSAQEGIGQDAERGVIINTSSIAAEEGQVGQVAYSASKAGVIGMTLPAARELAKWGIRVMTIAPGVFATPMVTGMPETVQSSLAATIPFPARLGDPKEYAALVKQIIENPFLNGSVIRLDGALRMGAK